MRGTLQPKLAQQAPCWLALSCSPAFGCCLFPAAVPVRSGYHCAPQCSLEPGGGRSAELGTAVAHTVKQGGRMVPFR
jgi:hypothetical protein